MKIFKYKEVVTYTGGLKNHVADLNKLANDGYKVIYTRRWDYNITYESIMEKEE